MDIFSSMVSKDSVSLDGAKIVACSLWPYWAVKARMMMVLTLYFLQTFENKNLCKITVILVGSSRRNRIKAQDDKKQ